MGEKMKRIIFVGFTPYQLMISIYYAIKLSHIHKCEKILIWHDYANYKINFSDINPFFERVFIVPYYDDVNKLKKQFLKRRYTGQGFKNSKIGQYVKSCKNDTILICFSDMHELTNKLIHELAQKNNKILLIEEGIGIYSTDYSKLPIRTKIINKILGISTEKAIGINKNISAVILNHPEWLENSKFIGTTLLQQNSVFEDNNFISELSFITKKIESFKKSRKKIILWLGDPIEDIGGTKTEEIDLIIELSKNLGENYMILIKPHPREDQNKYQNIENTHIRLIKLGGLSWVPIEIIASYLNFQTVITSVSSAAFNIYKIMDCIQVIYVYNILHDLNFDRTMLQPILSKKNIYCPATIKQLLDLIKIEKKFENQKINKKDRNEDVNFLVNLLGDEKNGR